MPHQNSLVGAANVANTYHAHTTAGVGRTLFRVNLKLDINLSIDNSILNTNYLDKSGQRKLIFEYLLKMK